MAQPPSSSLLPNHSIDLAADLSAHLSSALSDDASYQATNDAKLRGVANLVGWDQFHGMVLTAHLKPVNLRAEPIDEIARGQVRAKKTEQVRAANMDAYARGDVGASSGSALSPEQQALNASFLQSLDMSVPLSAHEWARDWKRLEAQAGSSDSEKASLRYRYLLALPVQADPSTAPAQVFKGSLPLNLIPEIVLAVHTQWNQAAPADPVAAADAVAEGDAATAASTAASAAAVDASAAATASPAVAAASSSDRVSSDVHHVLSLLSRLMQAPAFPMALFSLTAVDKARLAELLDQAQEALEAKAGTDAGDNEGKTSAALVEQLRTKFKLPRQQQ